MVCGILLSMKYKIKLEATKNDIPPLVLTLKPLKHSLAQRWSEQLNQLIENKVFLEKHYAYMGFPNALRGLAEIADELNQCIEIINRFPWEKDFHISKQASEKMTQNTLNEIHHAFEILMGQTWAPAPWFEEADQKTRVAIMFLNHLIHEYEYKKRSFENLKKWGHCPSSLNFAFSGAPHFDLEDDDMEYFSLRKTFGAVYIHYSQLGKTFQEAFFDQDDIVQDENINGHRYFTGEFDLYLGPSTHPNYLKRHTQELHDWLREKGLDPNDKRLCLGEAQVASLVPSYQQRSWDFQKFQSEIAKRPNITQISYHSLFQKGSCEYLYSSKKSREAMEKYFNSGSWN